MKAVIMFADSLGEAEFSPEHSQNILKYQQENHIPEDKAWKLVGDKWEFKGGKLMLTKPSNGNKSDTGVGEQTPQSKRNTTGSDSQP